MLTADLSKFLFNVIVVYTISPNNWLISLYYYLLVADLPTVLIG